VSVKKEERLMIVREQGGLSPLTGRPLVGQRLETHHIVELCEGGLNERSNKQALPITEHLAEHMLRSFDPRRNEEQRIRELDTVFGRLNELSLTEKKDLSELIYSFSGRKIHFV
jgi:hypothetical protein